MQHKTSKARAASFPQIKRVTAASKNVSFDITSESIAADLSAFRKQGGRIEVLGNTPLRANVTAFSSRGNAHRKPAAAKA